MAQTLINNLSYSTLDATKLSGNLPAISGASLTGISGGKVGQVLSTKITGFPSTSSQPWVDISGFSVSITPTSTSSKVYVTANLFYGNTVQTSNNYFKLLRDSTDINICDAISSNRRAGGGLRLNQGGQDAYTIYPIVMSVLDSPSTTSATTYKVQWGHNAGTGYLNRPGTQAGTNDLGSNNGVSTITVMEILA